MILLVDNYDSFTYNLVQYLGQHVEVEVLRNDDARLRERAELAEALVFSPGPGWPKDAGLMEDLIAEFAEKKPILGICLGHQALAEVFGGRLDLAKQVMHGKQSQLVFEAPSPLYEGVEESSPIMRYHSIAVEQMPEDFEVIARTEDDGTIMAIQHKNLPLFGLQYHPESIGSPAGEQTLKNFLGLVKERDLVRDLLLSTF